MHKVKSKAISFVTALLLVFTLLPFLPEGVISADAANNIVEVKTESELFEALKDESNKGKTIMLMSSLTCQNNSKFNVIFPVTLNLNANEMSIPVGIVIDLPNENDTVNITGGGTIRGFSYEQAPILLKKGKLNFYDGSVISAYNYTKKTGPDTIESQFAYSNIKIVDGEFTSHNKLNDKITLEDGTFRRDDYSSNTQLWTTKISKKYGIRVSGVEVTADNQDDILGGGEASFDLDTKTLTLKKDITKKKKNAIEYEFKGVPDLTIKVAKDVTLNSGEKYGIVIRQNATITGSKLLKVKSTSCGISVNAGIVPIKKSFTLNIENARIVVTGGDNGIIGEESALLNIKNSNINVSTKSSATNAVGIGRFADITISGCKIYRPTDGKVTRISSDFVSITDKDGTDAPNVLIECEHELEHTAAKAATCTEEGNSEYWTCKKCGMYFGDKLGYVEIKEGSWVTPTIKHTFKEVAEKAATCTAEGNKHYYSCTVCKKKFMDNMGMSEYEGNSWVIPMRKHTFTEVPANNATCTTDGNKHYYSCSVCKKKFMDNMGMSEYEGNSWVIPAVGHKYGTPSYTWSKDNKSCTANAACTVKSCGYTLTEKAVVSYKITTAPTTTKTGEGTYTAKFTNSLFKTQPRIVTIPKEAYVWGKPTYKWTKTSSGYTCTATRVATNDSTKKQTETVTATYKVTTAAKCEAKGVGTYTANFTNTAFNSQSKTIDIAAAGHKWGDWRTTKEATTTSEGKKERTCSVCKKTETQTIPKKSNIPINRLSGSNRFETAAAISGGAYPKSASTVVLANGRKFADALAGATLAHAYSAPILLTEKDSLPAETLAEIKRLGATEVIILGGSGSVSAAAQQTLKDNGLTVTVVKGSSRFATAVEIAKATKTVTKADPTEIFFVSSDKFADALSVSSVAAIRKAPIIYLPKTGSIDADTAAYLKSVKGKIKNAYVIGGSGVIGADVMTAAAKALGLTVDSTIVRVKGSTKYDTCVAVNTKFASTLKGTEICVATGEDFPDALAGGVYAAKNTAPLFLINGKLKTPSLTSDQKAYLKSKSVTKITAFGGNGAVPETHLEDIAQNTI